jgi:hypothetical protein
LISRIKRSRIRTIYYVLKNIISGSKVLLIQFGGSLIAIIELIKSAKITSLSPSFLPVFVHLLDWITIQGQRLGQFASGRQPCTMGENRSDTSDRRRFRKHQIRQQAVLGFGSS